MFAGKLATGATTAKGWFAQIDLGSVGFLTTAATFTPNGLLIGA